MRKGSGNNNELVFMKALIEEGASMIKDVVLVLILLIAVFYIAGFFLTWSGYRDVCLLIFGKLPFPFEKFSPCYAFG